MRTYYESERRVEVWVRKGIEIDQMERRDKTRNWFYLSWMGIEQDKDQLKIGFGIKMRVMVVVFMIRRIGDWKGK